jgi:hypothetical protein
MKKLVSTLACALALLIWAHTPVLAIFVGTLRSDIPWKMLVYSPDFGAAVTVTSIDSRGRQVTEVFTVQPGSFIQTEPMSIPRGTRRIIIELDQGGGSVALLRVEQEAFLFQEGFCLDGLCNGGSVTRLPRVVFDVVP